jgi:hypothetical protein
MNEGNFWELLGDSNKFPLPLMNERAIEIVRRSSSTRTFKGIMARLALILGYARQYVTPHEELLIIGQFVLEPEVILCMEQSARIVKLRIHVHKKAMDGLGLEVAESHFNMIINKEGRIIDVRNSM